MRADAVRKFLLHLGLDSDEVKEERSGWVQAFCPLAPWTHGGGIDTRPSFYVRANDEAPSGYNCFGCEHKGGLRGLLHSMFVLSGKYPWEAAKIFMQEEIIVDDGDEKFLVEAYKDPTEIEEEMAFEPLDDDAFVNYPRLDVSDNWEVEECKTYLRKERRIKLEWADHAGVRCDPERHALVFTLTDADGNAYLMRARHRASKSFWTLDEKTATPAVLGIWFNMHNIDWSKPVVVVEGELDALRLMTLGRTNVMASATSSVTLKQINAIQSTVIILGYDNDKSGRKAHYKIKEALPHCVLFELDWGVVNKADGKPCKDAGDLLSKEQLDKVWEKKVLVR